jgi:dihydrofolate reductase
MSRLIMINNVTLDGVMQAPGRPDEDVRGDFGHGGWAVPYGDAVMGEQLAEAMAHSGSLLLGRRTYEDFFSYWPHQPDNPYTEALTNTRKYVVSTTLTEPLPWENSTLLTGETSAAVARLKEQPGKDIVILGSGELVRYLNRHDLIDAYTLLVYPLVLGSGTRLFPDGGSTKELRLTSSVTTSTGVIVATYQTGGNAR